MLHSLMGNSATGEGLSLRAGNEGGSVSDNPTGDKRLSWPQLDAQEVFGQEKAHGGVAGMDDGSSHDMLVGDDLDFSL